MDMDEKGKDEGESVPIVEAEQIEAAVFIQHLGYLSYGVSGGSNRPPTYKL